MGEERSEHGSDDSRALIIKKGVEWSVDFDRRRLNIDKSRVESSAVSQDRNIAPSIDRV